MLLQGIGLGLSMKYRYFVFKYRLRMCKQVSSTFLDIFSRIQILQMVGSSENHVCNIEKDSDLGNIKESGIPRISQCFTDISSSTCGFLPSSKIGNMSFSFCWISLSFIQVGIQIFHNKVSSPLKWAIQKFAKPYKRGSEILLTAQSTSSDLALEQVESQMQKPIYSFPTVICV